MLEYRVSEWANSTISECLRVISLSRLMSPGHSFTSWCLPDIKNHNKTNPLKWMNGHRMTPDVRLYSSNEHRGVAVLKTTLPALAELCFFLFFFYPSERATDTDTCTQSAHHPSIHYSSSSPFNSTIRLSRGSSLQSLQPVNSKVINNGAITIL